MLPQMLKEESDGCDICGVGFCRCSAPLVTIPTTVQEELMTTEPESPSAENGSPRSPFGARVNTANSLEYSVGLTMGDCRRTERMLWRHPKVSLEVQPRLRTMVGGPPPWASSLLWVRISSMERVSRNRRSRLPGKTTREGRTDALSLPRSISPRSMALPTKFVESTLSEWTSTTGKVEGELILPEAVNERRGINDVADNTVLWILPIPFDLAKEFLPMVRSPLPVSLSDAQRLSAPSPPPLGSLISSASINRALRRSIRSRQVLISLSMSSMRASKPSSLQSITFFRDADPGSSKYSFSSAQKTTCLGTMRKSFPGFGGVNEEQGGRSLFLGVLRCRWGYQG
ncbi:hypothetical protein FA13DRAFT_1857273 [Coprinellus micaceus]|uniref:Uncharacterized protein n=1 Tax=Coprinellus micaceus TaxID=71717 RepID=A0A4Y7TA20_COPMI|nr:hypothetical protein FA13DRAFT_1857273 [Coprinellus micaceus]